MKNIYEVGIIGGIVEDTYIKAVRHLGQILAKRDCKYHEAIKLYDIALRINSHDKETLMLKSLSLSDLGQKIEAIKTINKAIKYEDNPSSKSNYEEIKKVIMRH